jgi:hypothetical protein
VKKTILIFGILVIAFLAVGGVWLYAQQEARPAVSVPATAAPVRGETSTMAQVVFRARSTTSTSATTPAPLASSSPSHTLGPVGLSPNLVTSGASQPITLSATITDPDLIASSVDAVYSIPGAPGATILGTLNGDGLGDGVYNLVFDLPTLPSGTTEIDLQVTAAFRGALARTKSPLVPLYINPSVVTTGWSALTDSQNLFTIEIPPNWNLHLAETPDPDPFTTKSVQFVLPGGEMLFEIDVYTPVQWQALSTGITPVLVGQSAQYVFAVAQAQDLYDTNTLTAVQILSQLPAIYSTFKVL